MYELVDPEESIYHVLLGLGDPGNVSLAESLYANQIVFATAGVNYSRFTVPVSLLVKGIYYPDSESVYAHMMFKVCWAYSEKAWVNETKNIECGQLFPSVEALKRDYVYETIKSKIRCTGFVYSNSYMMNKAVELIETKYPYLKPRVEEILEGRSMSKALVGMRHSISQLVNEQNVLADYYSSLPENLRDLLIKKS